MYKCDHSGHDVELALLSLRSTPLDNHIPSPAELLNGRKYRTTMPSINNDTSSADNGTIRAHLEDCQQKLKQHYDKHTTAKTELTCAQPRYTTLGTSERHQESGDSTVLFCSTMCRRSAVTKKSPAHSTNRRTMAYGRFPRQRRTGEHGI